MRSVSFEGSLPLERDFHTHKLRHRANTSLWSCKLPSPSSPSSIELLPLEVLSLDGSPRELQRTNRFGHRMVASLDNPLTFGNFNGKRYLCVSQDSCGRRSNATNFRNPKDHLEKSPRGVLSSQVNQTLVSSW